MSQVLKLRAAKEVPFLRQCHVAGGADKTAYQYISLRAGGGIASGSRAHANIFIKSHSFVVSKVACNSRQGQSATQAQRDFVAERNLSIRPQTPAEDISIKL